MFVSTLLEIWFDSGSSNMGTDSGKKTITITNNINGHDIIFRTICVGVYAFAAASWTQYVYGWLNGTNESSMACHAAIGITGEYNGGTISIETDATNISISSTTLQIVDVTKSNTLYSNSSASANTAYNYAACSVPTFLDNLTSHLVSALKFCYDLLKLLSIFQNAGEHEVDKIFHLNLVLKAEPSQFGVQVAAYDNLFVDHCLRSCCHFLSIPNVTAIVV